MDPSMSTSPAIHHDPHNPGSLSPCVALLDTSGRIVAVSAGWNRLPPSHPLAGPRVGVGVDYLKECRAAFQDGHPVAEELCKGLSAVLEARLQRHQSLYTLGQDSWYEVSVYRVEGESAGTVVVVHEDVTDRRRLEERLRETEERYQLCAQGANDALWDWDVRRGRMHLSPRWKELLGYAPGEVGDTPEAWFDLIHPDDVATVREQMQRHLEGQSPCFESEHRVRARDGSYRWMYSRGVVLRDSEGHPYRMAGSHSDITQRKQVEEKLLHDALHDSLTGLPNRALFLDRLERAIARARRNRRFLFGVLAIDLDHFKVVNDSLGYSVGDELLRAFAQRFAAGLRVNDSMARTGGDEFFILLDDIRDVSDAVRVAERLQSVVEEPFNLNGLDVYVTMSMGIAINPEGAEQAPEELTRDAEAAMHQAKQLGRSRHHVFDSTIYQRAVNRLTLETDLRRAIDAGGLFLLYQPIIALETGKIRGFEALVRWRHAVRGVISPMEFIPIAEETGLIVPLGLVVLRQACQQLILWQKRFPCDPPLTMSVNLSGRQLAQPDFLATIVKIVQEADLEPRSLHFEVTESSFLDSTSSAVQMLRDLKGIGVGLYLDDFGTGYSSLSYLHRLPVDTLKIDRSFVMHMAPQTEEMEIVRTIVLLAHNLGMKVVAEGIETGDQLKILRGLDCEYGQGYYFSGPVDPEKAEAMLAEQAGSQGTL